MTKDEGRSGQARSSPFVFGLSSYLVVSQQPGGAQLRGGFRGFVRGGRRQRRPNAATAQDRAPREYTCRAEKCRPSWRVARMRSRISCCRAVAARLPRQNASNRPTNTSGKTLAFPDTPAIAPAWTPRNNSASLPHATLELPALQAEEARQRGEVAGAVLDADHIRAAGDHRLNATASHGCRAGVPADCRGTRACRPPRRRPGRSARRAPAQARRSNTA